MGATYLRVYTVCCSCLCCYIVIFVSIWPAADAYCLLEVYEVLTAKVVEYKLPIQLRSEAADYKSCTKKTKLEKKQDRISKKCDVPLSEVLPQMLCPFCGQTD